MLFWYRGSNLLFNTIRLKRNEENNQLLGSLGRLARATTNFKIDARWSNRAAYYSRVSLGIGLHAPYDTGKSGYYNMPSFGKSLGYHFAIGYPF